VGGLPLEGPNLSKVLEKQEVPVGKWQESEKQRKKNGLSSSAEYHVKKSKKQDEKFFQGIKYIIKDGINEHTNKEYSLKCFS